MCLQADWNSFHSKYMGWWVTWYGIWYMASWNIVAYSSLHDKTKVDLIDRNPRWAIGSSYNKSASPCEEVHLPPTLTLTLSKYVAIVWSNGSVYRAQMDIQQGQTDTQTGLRTMPHMFYTQGNCHSHFWRAKSSFRLWRKSTIVVVTLALVHGGVAIFTKVVQVENAWSKSWFSWSKWETCTALCAMLWFAPSPFSQQVPRSKFWVLRSAKFAPTLPLDNLVYASVMGFCRI